MSQVETVDGNRVEIAVKIALEAISLICTANRTEIGDRDIPDNPVGARPPANQIVPSSVSSTEGRERLSEVGGVLNSTRSVTSTTFWQAACAAAFATFA